MSQTRAMLATVAVKIAKRGKGVKGQFFETQMFGVPEVREDGTLEEMLYPAEYLATVTEKALREECKARNIEVDPRVVYLDALNRSIRQGLTAGGIQAGIRAFLTAKFPKANEQQINAYVGVIFQSGANSGKNLLEIWEGRPGMPGCKVLAPMLLGDAANGEQ